MSETNNRDFKGVWIPKEIWLDRNLSIYEKFYISVYSDSGQEKIADEQMKGLVSQGTLSKIKKSLYEKRLLKKITTPQDAKKIVVNNKGKGIECEWCGCKTTAIQKHHYPIPKIKGGTETVNICPNCHYEYHLILKDK